MDNVHFEEIVCPKGEPILGAHGNCGGFSQYVHVSENFACKIPESIPSHVAPPLCCAGITVYSPLKQWNVRNQKVGIIGIGGLGHLAIKFAASMGNEVWAFSTQDQKLADAIEFGATHLVHTDSKKELEQLEMKLDFILNTTYADLDWGMWLRILKPNGLICSVGFPASGKITIPTFDLIYRQRKFCGSNVGSTAVMKEMLEYAATHKIFPEVKVFPISQLPELWSEFEKDPKGKWDGKYRAVLDVKNGFNESDEVA